MSTVVLGLDLGTSGVRVIAVDPHGIVTAQATQPYPLLTPQPGWTEQYPTDWVSASFKALQRVVQQVANSQILALGLSGQMHGLVSLDATGSVIRPALLWNDQRTSKAVQEIEACIPRSELIQRTGNPAITGFQLPKILWLRSEESQAFSRLRHCLLPKDYIAYVLTGQMSTEPSDASGIGCLNLSAINWDLDILKALQLDPNLFPSIIGSSDQVGSLQTSAAAMTGLPVGLPVIAGGGDNAAAAIGLGITQTTLTLGSLSIGTSGVIFAPLSQPTPEPQGRAHLFAHTDGGYHLLGVTLAAAGSLRWYRDRLAPQASYEQLMALAATSPEGANGVLFVPHLAGERTPHLDPEARGAWVGLSLASESADLVRALLEGVAFSLKAALEVMTPLTDLQEVIVTGGGSRSAVWVQIVADVLGLRLIHPQSEEGAAYGAALLALVGSGVYPNLESALQIVPKSGAVTEPNYIPAYEQGYARYRSLYPALRDLK